MAEHFRKTGLTDGASSENGWDESEHPRGQPDNKGQFVKKGNELSKSEWRRYYDTLGEIQAGTVSTWSTDNGTRWVALNVNVEQDGTKTPARLILDNGSYVSPEVTSILTFDTDDELYDFVDDILNMR